MLVPLTLAVAITHARVVDTVAAVILNKAVLVHHVPLAGETHARTL